MTTDWAPTGPDAIGYDIARSTDGGGFTTLGSPSTAAWSQTLASGHQYQSEVRLRYDGGSTSAWVSDANFNLMRLEEKSSFLTYSGGWTTLALSGASRKAVRTTSTPGSSVAITTTARSVSLVSTTGRKMALINVYVNGELYRTIDLKRAENNITRRIVWVGQFTTSQSRTIKFVAVKKGTRKRVDIDAVIVLA